MNNNSDPNGHSTELQTLLLQPSATRQHLFEVKVINKKPASAGKVQAVPLTQTDNQYNRQQRNMGANVLRLVTRYSLFHNALYHPQPLPPSPTHTSCIIRFV